MTLTGKKLYIVLALVFFFGLIVAPKRVVDNPKVKEVVKEVEVNADYSDYENIIKIDNEIIKYAALGFNSCTEMIDAIGNQDAMMMKAISDDMVTIADEVTILSDQRASILKKIENK